MPNGKFQKDIWQPEKEEEDDVFMGKVVFFDAFPEMNQELFDVDIVTCHYGAYYTPETDPPPEPGDWYSPKPIPFLAVRKGSNSGLPLPHPKKAWQRRHGRGSKTPL